MANMRIYTALSIIVITFVLVPTFCHQLQQTNNALSRKRGFMIPLQQQQHSGWRRHLLRSGSMPVYGSMRELGYFFASLEFGTPARRFNLIIDTGSTITYIPCQGCKRCGKHQSEWFNPETSSTARRLPCGDPLCSCGQPSCSCGPNNYCQYRRSYAEGSSSEGFLISDVLNFPDRQPAVPLVFGCIDGETGELYRQLADGLVGLGNSDNAIHSQMVRGGVIEDVFSLCFGLPRNGVLLLGDVALPAAPRTVYTPLLTSLHLHYYNVRVEGIAVAGERLPLDASHFDRGYGVVLDSGTTFTYLPSVAMEAMAKVIGERAEARGLQRCPGADPQYNDICWKGAGLDSFQDLEDFFPPAEFVFGGGAALRLPPTRYLFLSRPGEYCLSVFDNGSSGTLIGTGSVLDVVVTYDRRNGRVGFTEYSCARLATDLVGGDPANNTIVEVSPPPPGDPRPPRPAPPQPSPAPPPPRLASPPPPKAKRTKPPTSAKAGPPPPPPGPHTHRHPRKQPRGHTSTAHRHRYQRHD